MKDNSIEEFIEEAKKKTPPGIGIQTHAIIKIAGDGIYITSGQHKETKKHHGIIMANHPTPSGCDRWMMMTSDNRGFDSHIEACIELKKILPKEYDYIKIFEGENKKEKKK